MGISLRLPARPAKTGPVFVEELKPLPDAWAICRRLATLPHLLFLDSAARHPELGRYSFITADPFDWIWSRGRLVHVSGGELASADPFAVLQERLAHYRFEGRPDLPPFQAGVAGVFGYDLCHHLERLPPPKYDDFAVPDLAVGLYDWVVAVDHELGRGWLISTGLPERQGRRQQRRARQRLGQVQRLLGGEPSILPSHFRARQIIRTPQAPVPGFKNVTSDFSRLSYLAAARRAIEYIHAGDCFQVNLAQRLLHPAMELPLALYGRLRDCNPAPFAGYFDMGEFAIASASPERFLRVSRGRGGMADLVLTRPIKGTRPRGLTPEQDRSRRDELLASAKDRAENVMIVDLLRNDLGRVCQYGSVRVDELCRLESFEYVHHLVSEVVGRLRAGLGPVDLLRAAFPGGSVTGAPKIRAMEIIAELEAAARGPYCGSLGYIGFDGAMDLNLLIRTFVMGKGWVQLSVGGGIVADSEPEREYEETWHKAEGMLRALPCSRDA